MVPACLRPSCIHKKKTSQANKRTSPTSPIGPLAPAVVESSSDTPSNPPSDGSEPVDSSAEQNSTDPPDSNPVPGLTNTDTEYTLSDDAEPDSPDEHYKAPSDTSAVVEPCDNEPSPLPPSPPDEDHTTAETSEAEEDHVGSSQVAEEVDLVDEPQPQHSPNTKSEEASVIAIHEGELPGEADTPLTTTLQPPKTADSPVELLPPPEDTTTLEEESIALDPPIMSAVSDVSALSDRPEMASVHPAHDTSYAQDHFQENHNTGYVAGPLDDEAAAAAGVAALAIAAAEAPDVGRKPKKDKERSHRKKEKSGDGTERVKEKKHRERGDRDRAKSRDRSDRDRTRDRSAHLDGGERSHDREHRDRTKSRDGLGGEHREKKHRTPEEKAEREARKALKRGQTPAPMFTDNVTAEPIEQPFEPHYEPHEEDPSERRKHKRSSKRSTPAPFIEPSILDPEPPHNPDQPPPEGKKKSKKSRPPPITISPHAQPYNPSPAPEDPLKRRKSSKSKAEAVFGESIPSAIEGQQGPPPHSPYFDGPIEQPKRKKSSKKHVTEGVEIEPVQVVYEPDAQPPKSRRSRSNSVKPEGSGSGSSGGDKKAHRRKDSAHLTPEEREERRRKHEEKALRKGKELETHLRSGSKEERRAEKAAKKAAKARAEARENIPAPPLTPYDLPIQNPEEGRSEDGSQLRSPYLHHRDEQDGILLSPRQEQGEMPMTPRSYMDEEEAAAKAEKARRRAERKARKEEAVKDSGHSLSSEGKREHGERTKKHKRSNRVPGTPEEEEARRIRKEKKREAKRQAALAALDGTELREEERSEVKIRKQRDSGSGRVRSGSEKYGSRDKEMYRELEIGAPVGYGNHSQNPWMAGAQQVEEEKKEGVVRRTIGKFLKF